MGIVTLGELARQVGGVARGDSARELRAVATLAAAGPHDVAFVNHDRYCQLLGVTAAGAVILAPRHADQYSGNAIIADNPHRAFALAAQLLHPPRAHGGGIHPSAVVEPSARVAATAWIGPLVVIEAGAEIGARCQIGPGCVIGADAQVGEESRLASSVSVADRSVIGRRCVVHAGAVIGSDGFGFARDGERWIKVPQLGRVVIGDDVEIGANTTIDRGALEDTVIGNGVKLDNLIQVAHNVRIGDHSAIAAQAGIAGSTRIGRGCTVGGQAGIIDHLEIADGVHVTATSLVTSAIRESGVYSSSLKAVPAEGWRRNVARLGHLDELARRLKQIEEQLRKLTGETKS